MPNQSLPARGLRPFLFRLVAFLIGLLLVSLTGELFFRLFPGLVNDPPAPPPYNYRIPDATYGWLAKEGYHWQGDMRDHAGTRYPVTVNFGPHGFRHWDDPKASGRKKVLFIGDSYTAGAQTSDEHLFYQLLADSLDIEVFAYGAAGFGTTQEALVVQRYIAEINPDLVVWQFCCNDFLDNYWALEEVSTYHVRMRRPYTLENGELTYRLAAEYPRNVKRWSYFLYFILKRVARARGTFDKPPSEPAEKWIAEKNLDYAPFARSVLMTDAAMKKMCSVLPPGTLLMAFDADHFQPQYDQIKRLCGENRIDFADGLPGMIVDAKNRGECVHTDDGYHWNNRGHQLVAAFLQPRIARMLGANQ